MRKLRDKDVGFEVEDGNCAVLIADAQEAAIVADIHLTTIVGASRYLIRVQRLFDGVSCHQSLGVGLTETESQSHWLILPFVDLPMKPFPNDKMQSAPF